MILFYSSSALHIAVLIFAVLSCIFDAYRVVPYTPLYPKQSSDISEKNQGKSLRILSSNVLDTNFEFHKILKLILFKEPDIILLLEADENWVRSLVKLNEIYKYQVLRPRSNGYGMLLYSKVEMTDVNVEYLSDNEVPSIFFDIKLNEQQIHMIALHPRPPGLKESTSKQRDNELKQTEKWINNNQSKPTVVFGDFNDVAWSHTSREFLRGADLLDPRRGRGFYNTFPVSPKLFFFRYPLDHVFHSKEFGVHHIERSDDIGSDHFPMFIELGLLN